MGVIDKLNWLMVIPARLNSKRLPRKPLIEIAGKTIIERTYQRAIKAIKDTSKIVIATDSREIMKHCEGFGSQVCMTSPNCLTGTDRVAEVSKYIKADQYINLQGDEPIFPINELQEFIKQVNVNNNYVFQPRLQCIWLSKLKAFLYLTRSLVA